MKKYKKLLNESDKVLAEKLNCSEITAWRVKYAIKHGVYGEILKNQLTLLFKHYGLTPNDVIDYGKHNG